MTPSDYAAWWGALTASGLLIFEIYRHIQSGPKVIIEVRAGMQSTEDAIAENENEFVLVTVSNVGDRPTTMTHLLGKCYLSVWEKIKRKPSVNFLVPTPLYARPLPYVINPGKTWTGCINQTEEVTDWINTGRFFCGIAHSGNKKSQFVKVRPNI